MSDCCLTPIQQVRAIACREQVNFHDDEVRFVLDQHAELDFYSASLSRPGLEHTIYRTGGEHDDHYATDAVFKCCGCKQIYKYKVTKAIRRNSNLFLLNVGVFSCNLLFSFHLQSNPNSNEYKLTAIVLDIAGHRLFKPVGIKKNEIDKRSLLKLSFAFDGINLGNILHHKSVKSKIPPYFKDQSVPIISYAYTRPIA